MADKKIYTATDFSRYHSGEMNAAEMHALEKAALSDPFLADALEGYAYAETPADDLAALRQQITKKQAGAKVFFLSPRANNGWLRIAALLVIFAGAGYMFYRFNETAGHQEPLAKNTTDAATQPDWVLAGPPHIDATQPAAGKTHTDVSLPVASGKLTTAKTPPVILNLPKSVRRDESVTAAGQSAMTSPPPAPEDKQRYYVPEKELLKNIYDSIGQATSIAANGSIPAGIDRNAAVKMKSETRDVSAATGFSNVYKKETSRVTADEKKHIQLESDKDEEENRAALKAGVEEKGIVQPEYGKMEPIDSVVFNDYLAKNVKPVTDSAGTRYEGNVILSFTVNKSGRPENIKVDRSLCKACDEQALALLKNGPRWIYAQARRKIVVVNF